MARILIAWELGNGNGNIARLLPPAVELQRRDHESMLVLRDVIRAQALVTRRVLNEPGFASRAREFAEKYRGHDPLRAVGHIADRCEQMIAPAG